MPLGLLKSAKNYAGHHQRQAYSGEAVKCEKVAMSESASSQRLLPPLTSPEEAAVNWKVEDNLHFDMDLKSKEKGAVNNCQAVLNYDEENEITITGYRLVKWKWFLTMFIMVGSAGLLWLLLYWIPKWKLLWTHEKVDLAKADTLLIEDEYKKDYKRYYVEKVFIYQGNGPTKKFDIPIPDPHGGATFKILHTLRLFFCKKETYLWDEELKSFYLLKGLDYNVPNDQFYQQMALSKEQQELRRLVYGPNDINVPNNSIGYLLITEVLNPFYIFQVASVILWTSDEYYYYAAAIVLMSVSGIVSSVYQTKKNEENLRSTIRSSNNVMVQRSNDTIETISSSDLVPGDIIVLPNGGKFEMSCDAVLIYGNVIVNEAMLTGESVPVTKTPIARSASMYQTRAHQKHTLLCGTEVIQTRAISAHSHVLAVVTRTGFCTTKGNLVRSIMYPAPVDFKFEEDSYKFVGFLTLVASIGFGYTCYRLVQAGEKNIGDIFLDAADLITIVIPPALPAAMTIGSIYAQKRLKEKGIFCISPRTINVSGSVQCVCFDKTGTLTEDGLDMLGTVPVKSEKFDILMKEGETIDHTEDLIKGMSACHSLTIIDEKLSGDPIDLKMFEFTKWTLIEGQGHYTSVKPPSLLNSDPEEVIAEAEIGIFKQFQFSSDLQCMSVIVRDLSTMTFKIYCKGSPEKLKLISKPESIPENFQEILDSYTENGYRVIALGMRPLSTKVTKIDKLERSDVEKDLIFLGLIVFENRIKKESKPVIEQLQNAKMRTVMVTGDHIQTALSVAKECKMISTNNVIILKAFIDAETQKPHYACHKSGGNNLQRLEMSETQIAMDYVFATDGKSFTVIRQHFPDVYERLCTRGTVFARMTPDQKEFLIEELQELGYYVGMCGDGANDCGALKAAHAGISLSDAEASVASPFTSKNPNISCVPNLIREGRAALITSFGIFKYMAAYSLTQYLSVLILYEYDSNLTDLQYLYIDLFLITIFAFFFGLTKAYEGELAKRPPNNSLIDFIPITSLLLQLVVIASVQFFGLFYVENQEWFVAFDYDNPGFVNTSLESAFAGSTIEIKEEDNFACLENYAIFTLSAFQYIILAYVFSKSKPYRKWVVTNVPFLASLLILTAATVWLTIDPSPTFQRILEILPVPEYKFRWQIIGIACVNTVLCIFLEEIVTETCLQKLWKKYGLKSKTKYNQIESWMQKHAEWPLISSLPVKVKSKKEVKPKSYPFTVEVIEEDDASNPKLDFRNDENEIHSHAHVLNDASS